MNILNTPSLGASVHTDASRDTRRAQLEAVSEQFEALFLQQILKQMRKAADVLGADSPLRSREADTFRDFYDGALAEALARKRQAGIAELLVRQLGGDDQPPAVASEGQHMLQAAQQAGTAIAGALQRGVEGMASLWQRGAAGFQALVESVIRHESAGDAAAVSPKGARGLMQLMPDTARELAAELGLAYSEERLTADPDFNRRLGSAYLEKLLRRYDGHYALAVAAYNAGPSRVDAWLQRNGDPRTGEIDTAEWVRRIPFPETRRYTVSILADLQTAPAPRPGVSPGRAAEVNGAAAPVALPESESGAVGAYRSPAFAPPIRIEAKGTV